MANPIVQLTTNKGIIKLELDAEKAPNSVINFLQYVDTIYCAQFGTLYCSNVTQLLHFFINTSHSLH